MPWYRWTDPAREGVETEIRMTSGRVVRGRIVSYGALVDDPATLDFDGPDVQTTVVDEHGCYYTGREARELRNAPPAAA